MSTLEHHPRFGDVYISEGDWSRKVPPRAVRIVGSRSSTRVIVEWVRHEARLLRPKPNYERYEYRFDAKWFDERPLPDAPLQKTTLQTQYMTIESKCDDCTGFVLRDGIDGRVYSYYSNPIAYRYVYFKGI